MPAVLSWRTCAPAAILVALLALPVVAGAAATPGATDATPAAAIYEPNGFAEAKFGMSLKDVWKLYPKARLLGEQETLGAAVLDGPYIERLELRDARAPGFPKPTTVELRFWKGKLWGVIVFFGDNDPKECEAYLFKTFGPTTAQNKDLPIWRGPNVTTTATLSQKWYGYTDNALSAEVTAWVGQALKGSWMGPTAEEKAARAQMMAEVTPKVDEKPGSAAAATPAAKE